MEQNEMKAKTPFNPIHSVLYWKLSIDLDSYWDSKWTPVWTNSSEGAATCLIILPASPFSLRCKVYQHVCIHFIDADEDFIASALKYHLA